MAVSLVSLTIQYAGSPVISRLLQKLVIKNHGKPVYSRVNKNKGPAVLKELHLLESLQSPERREIDGVPWCESGRYLVFWPVRDSAEVDFAWMMRLAQQKGRQAAIRVHPELQELDRRLELAAWQRGEDGLVMSGEATASPLDPHLGMSWETGKLSLWLGSEVDWWSRCDLYFSDRGAALFNLETDHAKQRRGYARRLLRCAQNELLKRGESRLILKVGSENHPAVNLYRDFGLTEKGRYWFRMGPRIEK